MTRLRTYEDRQVFHMVSVVGQPVMFSRVVSLLVPSAHALTVKVNRLNNTIKSADHTCREIYKTGVGTLMTPVLLLLAAAAAHELLDSGKHEKQGVDC